MIKVLIVAAVFVVLFGLWIWRGISIGRAEQQLADELAPHSDDGDPHLLAVAERAWQTGKPVIGTVDDDGKLTMREIRE